MCWRRARCCLVVAWNGLSPRGLVRCCRTRLPGSQEWGGSAAAFGAAVGADAWAVGLGIRARPIERERDVVCVFTGGGRTVPEFGGKRTWLIPGMGEATSSASGTQVHNTLLSGREVAATRPPAPRSCAYLIARRTYTSFCCWVIPETPGVCLHHLTSLRPTLSRKEAVGRQHLVILARARDLAHE